MVDCGIYLFICSTIRINFFSSLKLDPRALPLFHSYRYYNLCWAELFWSSAKILNMIPYISSNLAWFMIHQRLLIYWKTYPKLGINFNLTINAFKIFSSSKIVSLKHNFYTDTKQAKKLTRNILYIFPIFQKRLEFHFWTYIFLLILNQILYPQRAQLFRRQHAQHWDFSRASWASAAMCKAKKITTTHEHTIDIS